jgi:hypothetical protein
MPPAVELPVDRALPALAAIRARGLAGAIPTLDLGDDAPVELRLCTRVPGSRATFHARAGDRQFAVKLYAEDPVHEAALYHELARAGLTTEGGPRAPPLVAWDRYLKVLVLGWLDGRPANDLIKQGRGDRAGELAAAWLRRVAALPATLGPPCGVGRMLYLAGVSVAALSAVNTGLGGVAKRVARVLGRAQPREGPRRLVHGTLYARHILDLGDGPGVIDWQQFGQGPIEVDAGMFLATVARLGLRRPHLASEAGQAATAFLAETEGLVDRGTLDWYEAAGLLHLAARGVKTGLKSTPPPEARALVDEAGRLAERAASNRSWAPTNAAPNVTLRRSALELVLSALSTRPATPQELDQIRQLLDDASAPPAPST